MIPKKITILIPKETERLVEKNRNKFRKIFPLSVRLVTEMIQALIAEDQPTARIIASETISFDYLIDDIRKEFGGCHRASFDIRAHIFSDNSASVSPTVSLYRKSEKKPYYCRLFGFTESEVKVIGGHC